MSNIRLTIKYLIVGPFFTFLFGRGTRGEEGGGVRMGQCGGKHKYMVDILYIARIFLPIVLNDDLMH